MPEISRFVRSDLSNKREPTIWRVGRTCSALFRGTGELTLCDSRKRPTGEEVDRVRRAYADL